jgi:hypothetical protein
MITADFSGTTWRKSSRSSDSGNCVEVAWRKSSRSSNSGNCVEVAHISHAVGVRDSKHPEGPILIYPAAPWVAFLRTR